MYFVLASISHLPRDRLSQQSITQRGLARAKEYKAVRRTTLISTPATQMRLSDCRRTQQTTPQVWCVSRFRVSSPSKGSEWIIATDSRKDTNRVITSKFPVGTRRLVCATEGGRRFQQGVSCYTFEQTPHYNETDGSEDERSSSYRGTSKQELQE